MGKFTYVEPRPAYIEYLALHLRAADVAEIKAASGDDVQVENILHEANRISETCDVGISHRTGLPTLIRGIARLDDSTGVIWMVATDELTEYPRYVLVEGRRFVEHHLANYDVLYNYADVRNTASLNWLERIGFTFDPPAPFGPAGLPFQRFERRRDGVRAATSAA